MVRPYVAFSMLHPVTTVPSMVSSAAPTLNFENDACAFRLAWRAARIRSESFNDALQQPHERTADAPSGFEHFFVVQ
jgi:hypothetical protein